MGFMFSDTNKRYHTFSYYLKKKYNNKIAKLSLDAGFTCPNRDGSKSVGGCSFCSEHGSGEYAGSRIKTIKEQMDDQIVVQTNKWPDAKFIAYFQAYTNTYCDLDTLKEKIEPVFENKDVVALSLGTRPDCLEDDKLEYLNSLTSKMDVWVELGLQTIHSDTFNRAYEFEVFKDTLKRIENTNVKVCVHLINGLPGETKEMMVESAKTVSSLGVDAIKIHNLFITKNTAWEKEYANGTIPMITKDEYIDIVVEQLRWIKPEIVLQRLTGDPDKETLIAPLWPIKKTIVLNDIDKKMVELNCYQGDKLEK